MAEVPASDIPPSDIAPDISSDGGGSTPTEGSLSPDTYVYTTPKAPENFGKVPYNPPLQSQWNLTPPTQVLPQTSTEVLCSEYPDAKNCHEEKDVYKSLGFFADENRDIFQPELRNPKSREVKKPVNNLYENKVDDIQLDVPDVRPTSCKCKDGRVVQGYINMRNGQKDCSNCQTSKKSYPNAYKNYKSKPRVSMPRTDIHQPLRKQVGVSHFGDVNMNGCSVITKSGKIAKSENTLNRVVNISSDAPRGSIITQQDTQRCMPDGYSLYDNCPTNVFGV